MKNFDTQTSHQFIAKANIAIAFIDTDFCYRALSDKWKILFEIFDQTILGSNHLELFGEESNQWKQLYEKVLTGTFKKIEAPFKKNSGIVRWLNWDIQPYFNDFGEITGIYLQVEDTTDRKKNDHLLQEIYEVANVGGWEIDFVNNTVYFTDIAKQIFEIPTDFEPTIDNYLFRIKTETDKQLIANAVLNTKNNGLSFSHEVLTITENKQDKWIKINGKAVLDKDMCVRVFGTLEDIDEQKKLAAHVQKSEEQFRGAFENSAIGMALIKPDGRWIEVNNSLCNILGYTKEELLQFKFQDVTHADDIHTDLQYLQDLIDGVRESYHLEKRYIHKNGHVIWALLGVSLVHDQQGNPLHFISQVKDITKTKETEQRILASEQKFRTLFKLSPVAFSINDLETGKYIDFNDAFAKDIGYTNTEIYALSYWDVIPKEYQEIEINILNALSKTGHFGPYELEFTRKDGSLYPVLLNGVKIKDSEGKDIIWTVVQNLADIKQKGKELSLLNDQISRSNYRLKAAQEIGKLGYWELNIQTKESFWSDEVYRIFGIDKSSYAASYDLFYKMIHPEDRNEFHKGRRAALSGMSSNDIEYRIVCPDNSIKFVYQRMSVVYDEDRNPIRFEGIVQDITMQKKGEHHLKVLESVIINLTDAVVITEVNPTTPDEQRIVYVNDSFTKMTGYTKDEVIGKSPKILQGPKSDRNELDRLKKSLQRWEPCEIETVNYKKNGDAFWINFSVSPVANQNGNYTHWIAIERDVTERKKYIQEIEDQNKKLREIAWTQSHVLRAPVAKIMGLVNLLNDTTFVENSTTEVLNYITSSATELDDIIRKIVYTTETIEN